MKTFDCDLQLHGKFASGVSKNLTIPLLSQNAKLKGLELLSTADIQHKEWFDHVKAHIVETENGVYMDKHSTVHFLIGTEVEDHHRLHHLIYLPDLTRAQEFRDQIKGFGTLDCSLCGRPRLHLSANQIAQIVLDLGGILGPAHSFTPYTGLFSKFNSLHEAYGELVSEIPFLELGLSADTALADTIANNHAFAFLSSSDAHSAWPHRLGREFNRIQMKKPSFTEFKDALFERTEPRIILNAGLDPREGKYHATACNACFAQFGLREAEDLFHWKCPNCKTGQIKKGVRDRINELADTSIGTHPAFRPPYKHMLPLSEIIQQTLRVKNVLSKEVQTQWRSFVDQFENEIAVLLDIPDSELQAFNPAVAQNILAFRAGLVLYEPGGGGQYGTPIICQTQEEFERKKTELAQNQFQKNKFTGQKTLNLF